jgi:GNAT superfamily N-acetyltransferase
MDQPAIQRLMAVDDAQLEGLTDLLIGCVEGGASVSFMLPLSRERARSFWRGVADAVARGERALLVAEAAGGRIVGTVHLVLAQPENQPHRADLAKMLVSPGSRRAGLGARLLQAAEQAAAAEGKTLLVLDTVTGGAGERLYERQGWQRCGVIPGYALWPGGGLCATTVFFKPLGA